MAKSKKRFKRKKEDRFISYVLIGFSVVFFVIILSIILYNVLAQPLTYDNFDRITDYSLIDKMPEDEYLVYYYTEDCSWCKEIKNEVLEFANENNAGIKPACRERQADSCQSCPARTSWNLCFYYLRCTKKQKVTKFF